MEAEPDLRDDVLFCAVAVSCIDARVAAHLMDAWENDPSSLRSATRPVIRKRRRRRPPFDPVW